MASKIKSLFTKNWGYKILAICLAFILWLVVYNINDPNITVTFTTSVTVENASSVTDQNLTYEILDGTSAVTFAVTGKRSIVRELVDSDFKAVADLSRMVMDDDGETATVQLDISSSRYNSSLSYPNKRYLKISLENLMTKQLVVSAGTSGTVADGYALGEVAVTNPNVIKVSGPESIVSTVSSVVAVIDVDGMSVNLSDNVVPVLRDATGRSIDTTRLTLSSATVTVSAKILPVKTLPLSFSTTGTPAAGYEVMGISGEPSEVQVKGAAATLNTLSFITIPDELFDISGMAEDMVAEIDITDYLPDGVELVDTADAKVTVTVQIGSDGSTGGQAAEEDEEPAEAEEAE